MARARLLKPSFFTNSTLGKMPICTRVLFQGLWCVADREGRLKDDPMRLKVEILPYDRVNVHRLLNQLADAGFIVRYEEQGERYIQVVNFTKHQSPHVREPASTIPAPPQHRASTGLEPDQTGTGPAVAVAVIDPVAVAESVAAAASSEPSWEDVAVALREKLDPVMQRFGPRFQYDAGVRAALADIVEHRPLDVVLAALRNFGRDHPGKGPFAAVFAPYLDELDPPKPKPRPKAAAKSGWPDLFPELDNEPATEMSR